MITRMLKTRFARRLVYLLCTLMVLGGQPLMALQEHVRFVPREETWNAVRDLEQHLETWWDGAWQADWTVLPESLGTATPAMLAAVPFAQTDESGEAGGDSQSLSDDELRDLSQTDAVGFQEDGASEDKANAERPLPSHPDLKVGASEFRPPKELIQLMAGKADLDGAPLIPGWNLLSIPEEPADPDPATVLAPIAGAYTRAYAFDNCDAADPWKVYDPADLPNSDLTVLDHTKGFWLEATSAVELPFDGTLPATTTIPICPGWNLIGYPAGQARHVTNALYSIEGKYQRVYGYDATDPDNPWEVYSVGVPEWGNDLSLMYPGRGYWVLATEATTLEIANEGPDPVVEITSPADLGVVTDFTDVVGNVDSPILESWTLTYQLIGEGEPVEIASGVAPLAGGVLGTFDPTLLINGLYELKLEATDLDGRVVEDTIAVSVEGNMKLGNFTLSFIDLAVPLAGLNIEIVRTYDSRRREIDGDFGFGWFLDIRQGSYQNNRLPGDGWQIVNPGGPFGLPCTRTTETKSHVTTISLSEQEVYRFRLSLTDQAPLIGGCQARAFFQYVDGPLPGSTLEILGNDLVIYENEGDRLLDQDSFQVFEPDNVRMKTRDGRIFHLNIETGVTHLEDLSGNEVEISVSGVTHSSGVGINFLRDAEGRIQEIEDPNGSSVYYSHDLAGDLVSQTGRAGGVSRFTYRDHYLEEIFDAMGARAVRNEYDDRGRLISTTDGAGNTITVGHDLDARREVITDRLSFVQILEYDDRGNVVREIDKLGHETQRTYDTRGNMLTETDPLGRTMTFTYTARNDLATVTDPLGHTTTNTYDTAGRLLSTMDPRGNVTTNTYDSSGNLLSIEDAAGNTKSFTYDEVGNPVSETDELGNTRYLEYDGSGYLVKTTDALGSETRFTYNSTGEILSRETSRSQPGGTQILTTLFSYNGLGQMVRETRPDGGVTTNEYDLLGRLLSSTDAGGNTTYMTYSSAGLLTSLTTPGGSTVQHLYDVEGREVGVVSRSGENVSMVRDAMGRHLSTTMPDGSVTSNTYDAAGQIVAQTAANGTTLGYSYDAAGRLTAITDSFGTVTRTYDEVGNVISTTDPAGNTTTMAYDALNRRISTTYPDGTSVQTTYDPRGRRSSSTDQAGNVTSFEYDGRGHLLKITDALEQETRYSYDELGNLVAQTDAEGRITTYSYDEIGRRVGQSLPDGSSETYTYNLDGTLASKTNANGHTIGYSYDADKNLIRRSYPDGNEITFTYTANGRRKSYTDKLGTTSYTYDSRDRVTSVDYPDGRSMNYTYDQLGKRNSMTAVVGTSAFETSYGYDVLSRLASVSDHLGRTTTLSYGGTGSLESFTYPNGVTTKLSYDTLSRLTQLRTEDASAEALQSYDITLSANGNKTRILDATGVSRNYTYDALNRLTVDRVEDMASTLIYQQEFAYDSVGNRQSLTRDEGAGPATTLYSYDTRDRLLAQGGVNYGWDANGNRISKDGPDGASYSWDYDNRLAAVSLVDGTQVKFTYDPDGVLVRHELISSGGSPVVTDYLNDTAGAGLSHAVVESRGATVETVYTRADDRLVSLYRPANDMTRFFHTDPVGSTRMLTDEFGAPTDTYEYTAFGVLLDHVGSDPQPYQFAGEPYDPNAGFNYHRARWLDMAVGRFVSTDPLPGRSGDPLSLHRYLYANADPVGKVDPTGLFSAVNVGLTALTIGLVLSAAVGITFYSLALHFMPKGFYKSLKDWPDAGILGFQLGASTELLTRWFKHPIVFGILAGLMAFTAYIGFELLIYGNRVDVHGTAGLSVGVPVASQGPDGYAGAAYDTDNGAGYPGYSFCTGMTVKKIPWITGACFSTNKQTFSVTVGKYSSGGVRIVSSLAWASLPYSVPYSDLKFEIPPLPKDILDVKGWAERLLDQILRGFPPPFDPYI